MIPRPFAYERPTTVEEAVSLLAAAGERDVKALAGGQSLIPMLSLGLARPDLVIDLGALELDGLERENGRVRVGARTTHRTLELAPDACALLPLAAAAARHIGNPRVRNRGTFGGSLAHADPAAELPAVLLAQEGSVLVRGPRGDRRIPAEDFFLGYLETALAPDELIVAAELDVLQAGTGVGFEEAANRADDFATALAAAVVTLEEDGRTCAAARVVVAGVADRPLRLEAAEELVGGERETEALLARVAAAAEESLAPEEDAFVSAAFRRRLAGVCARRALARAWADARSEGAL
ncbi:MAG: FAD binding domain-containing protein [Acidimicrobiia bacterium]